jgi:hypothetical protein
MTCLPATASTSLVLNAAAFEAMLPWRSRIMPADSVVINDS